MAARTPADIARDTLKLLATRRLAPTPANYQAVYEEVAGLLPQVSFPLAPLRRIATVLPTQTPVQKRLAHSFSTAVEAQDWTALQAVIADYAQLDLGIAPKAPVLQEAPTAIATVNVLPDALAQQLARLIETTVTALGEEDQRMQELSDQLVHFLRTAPPPLATLEQRLHNYSYRLSFTAQDQAQRRMGMHALLRMVGEHIASLAAHDLTLQQQAQALATAMEQPWTLQQLDRIQTHLKSLLFRHLEIEGSRADAHEQLKSLLAEHAKQMASLGKLSENHSQALTNCAQQIQQAQDLGDLTPVLQAVVHSGSALATENRIVQAQLADLRAQTQAQEAQIEALSHALLGVEDSTRNDPETGALNAQGLQEALLTEAARNQRQAQPITLAALHIDQLAALEAENGPQAKTAALVHLARLVRATLRPQDAIGRIREQQFVILFPATVATQAAQALARLQQELSQRPLLLDDRAVPLSFSAGVIALSGMDTPAEAVQRALQACEQAQRMGLGRVALI